MGIKERRAKFADKKPVQKRQKPGPKRGGRKVPQKGRPLTEPKPENITETVPESPKVEPEIKTEPEAVTKSAKKFRVLLSGLSKSRQRAKVVEEITQRHKIKPDEIEITQEKITLSYSQKKHALRVNDLKN